MAKIWWSLSMGSSNGYDEKALRTARFRYEVRDRWWNVQGNYIYAGNLIRIVVCCSIFCWCRSDAPTYRCKVYVSVLSILLGSSGDVNVGSIMFFASSVNKS
jgi:hypothetical protein